jgi:transcriptional regulator with XRE-family HTH domain
LREQQRISQGVIEKRTGLLRCYISRVENGHTVPSVDTLEKMARASEVSDVSPFHGRRSNPEAEHSCLKRGTGTQ